MNKAATIFIIEISSSLLISIVMNDSHSSQDTLSLFATLNLIIGTAGAAFGALIDIMSKKYKDISTSIMIASGILLIIGIGTCSVESGIHL